VIILNVFFKKLPGWYICQTRFARRTDPRECNGTILIYIPVFIFYGLILSLGLITLIQFLEHKLLSVVSSHFRIVYTLYTYSIDLIAFGAYTSISKVAAAFVLCAEIPPTDRFYSIFVVSVSSKSAYSLAYRQVRTNRSDKAKIKAAYWVTLHTADKCCCKFGLRGTIRGR